MSDPAVTRLNDPDHFPTNNVPPMSAAQVQLRRSDRAKSGKGQIVFSESSRREKKVVFCNISENEINSENQMDLSAVMTEEITLHLPKENFANKGTQGTTATLYSSSFVLVLEI